MINALRGFPSFRGNLQEKGGTFPRKRYLPVSGKAGKKGGSHLLVQQYGKDRKVLFREVEEAECVLVSYE
jgi:hypothetical protein